MVTILASKVDKKPIEGWAEVNNTDISRCQKELTMALIDILSTKLPTEFTALVAGMTFKSYTRVKASTSENAYQSVPYWCSRSF